MTSDKSQGDNSNCWSLRQFGSCSLAVYLLLFPSFFPLAPLLETALLMSAAFCAKSNYKNFSREASVVLICISLIFIFVALNSYDKSEGLDRLLAWRKVFLMPIVFILVDSPSKLLFLMKTVFYSSFFAYAVGVIKILFYQYFDDPFEIRIFGLIKSNAAQSYVLMCSLFAFMSLRQMERMSKRSKSFGVALLSFSTISVVFTESKIGSFLLLTSLALCGFYLYLSKNRLDELFSRVMKYFPLILFAVAGWGVATFGLKLDSISNLFNEYIVSSSFMGGRLGIWYSFLSHENNPGFFGGGLGYISHLFVDGVNDPRFVGRFIGLDDPHNQFLHIFAEFGIFGLVIFFSVLAFALFRCFIDRNLLLLGFLCVNVVAFQFNGVLTGFVEGRFFFITSALLFLSTLPAYRSLTS